VYVFDIEANGLDATRIHCLVYKDQDGSLVELSDYEEMRAWLMKADCLIGNNIIRYDIPTLERILGIEIGARLIDTLALSWYLEPERIRHGLADWGEEFGIPKPDIDDWEGLTLEEYLHRCSEDVRINSQLWDRQYKHLLQLYEKDDGAAMRCVHYLGFKMKCAALQEKSRWKLDAERCERVLGQIVDDEAHKKEQLNSVMPKVPVYSDKTRPAKPFKQDGSLSVTGARWFNLLRDQGLPEDYDGVVTVLTAHKEPNAGSPVQVKNWLYSLGWEPETFKYKRDKETGNVRKIEQVNLPHGAGVCPSIKRLFDVEPNLALLDGLSVLTHRKSILKGFLENVDEEGYVKAEIQGFTNTLRFKHRVCVNLPGIDKAYGKDIRGCLIAPEGYELCGSDMSSLEDRTKQHYMWDHDPDYVREMMVPDFDPHIDIAVEANLMSAEEATTFKEGGSPQHKALKKVRAIAKEANYACVYGAGGATVARGAGISKSEGDALVDTYWRRNWAVNAVAEEQRVRSVKGQKWLFNPVSRLWYSLRHEKDRFSTLNQGTGVYCFDTWVKHTLKRRLQLTAQFHDEIVLCIKIGHRDKCRQLLRASINDANAELNLNRELDVDVQFGKAYSEIH
jgi:hypothetical protein